MEFELISQIFPILFEYVEGCYVAPFLGKVVNGLSSFIILSLKSKEFFLNVIRLVLELNTEMVIS